ncbi:hypothetical protein KGQ19_07040 [Catenulispora sp. NL8]|uniref:Lipoprotein n=1 Tax=Catenulispora pinistramenti TaxID=2705254 RepID=A0ABS5KKQ1_9ACTN|nr:hypothetical protein [Catenulispora pinistramenti]MBS2546619.1 hypothetical protein [Catenulispora pinistramenti]
MNRRRIAIGVSSVSGLAVVAAGVMSMFGSGGSANAVDLHTAPAAAVTGAAAATRQAGTAQVDTVVTVASPATPARGRTPAVAAQTLTMHGTGLFDFGKQVGSVDLTVPTGTLNEVLTPSTVYLRRSATTATATAAAAPATAWTKMATANVSDGNLISGGATEPSLVFAMLGGMQGGVKYVGQDSVRGTPVAHYQGTLDLTQAATALAGQAMAEDGGAAAQDAAADKQALTNAARAFTTTKVPFDAYLDGQGRLRRFVADFSFVENPTTKPVAQVTSATELYGFGTPVTVVMPTVAGSAAGSASGSASGSPAASGAAVGTPAGTESSPERRRSITPSTHPSSPTRSHK